MINLKIYSPVTTNKNKISLLPTAIIVYGLKPDLYLPPFVCLMLNLNNCDLTLDHYYQIELKHNLTSASPSEMLSSKEALFVSVVFRWKPLDDPLVFNFSSILKF